MAAAAVTLAALAGAAGPAAAGTPASALHSGQSLAAGQELVSGSGTYRLVMQGDGNLVVYQGGRPLWASNTNGRGGTRVVMQGDGNLVIYTASGRAVWASNTAGNWGVTAVMQNDGNFVLYAPTGRPLWASRGGRTGLSASTLYAGQTLGAGQELISSSGRYVAIMQHDGNFVVYAPGGRPLWASNTGGTGDRHTAVMQTDGNFVVYAPGGHALRASNTAGTGSDNRLVMQGDGNLVIYTASGRAVWATNTAGAVSGGGTGGGSETKAEAAAVAWAKNMIGSAAGKSGGEYWYGCLAFAINAYSAGANYAIRNDISITVGANTYPAEVWGHFRSGKTGAGNSPPAGALVFWDSKGGTTDSHVAISVGGGKLVSTNVDQPGVAGYNGIHYETMAQFASNSWNIYKGWWLPDK